MTRRSGLLVMVWLALSGAAAFAAPVNSNLTNQLYEFQLCHGKYALCAASICTPTGGVIEVNVAGGGTAFFPEAACRCPIYDGPALADLNGGNMQGSCDAPGKDQVWSLYWPKENVPQEINDWKRTPAATEVEFQLCSDSDDVGATFANCFSFACTIDRNHPKGVPTATCFCPLGEDPNGQPVAAHTAVITPAGQCNSSICSQHPVGAASALLDGQANECLGQLSTGS